MANRRRLRPADPSLPEYLENPFPEVRTENHSQPVPFRLPQPPSGFSAPARPALAKSISGRPSAGSKIEIPLFLCYNTINDNEAIIKPRNT